MVNSEGKFLMKLLSAGSGGDEGERGTEEAGSRALSVSVAESLGSAFKIGFQSLSYAHWLCDLGWISCVL